MSIEQVLGVKPIINAAGPLTRLSGMPMHPNVARAMAEAAQETARIEDLQAAAGSYLAEVTGAEAGYVTSGAAAGLTMSAAAAMAGMSVAAMDQLPDTTGLKDEIVVQRAHVTAYSHALRVAGAKLVDVGYVGYPGQGITWPWQIEAAITDRTAAIFYSVGAAKGIVELAELAEIGRMHGVPVIVDAAAALPPKENLKRFIEYGADLVAFSGGKAIGGPQASGILVGRKDLIESVALQHQDMDVYPDTWTWRQTYIESHRLPGPPHHGLGRAMKVGKEEIVGLVAALRRFLESDLEAERARQCHELQLIAEQVIERTEARAEFLDSDDAPRAYPTLLIYPPGEKRDRSVLSDLINRLVDGDPALAVSQNFTERGAIGVVASAMRSDQVQDAAARLVEEINRRR
jgi:D-glucosaminate-6-phosphate ammonia-lyase